MCRSKLCWYLRLYIGLGNLLLYEVQLILFNTFFIHKTLRTLDFRKLLYSVYYTGALYSRSNNSYYAPFPPVPRNLSYDTNFFPNLPQIPKKFSPIASTHKGYHGGHVSHFSHLSKLLLLCTRISE
jgi:hypothetical protein